MKLPVRCNFVRCAVIFFFDRLRKNKLYGEKIMLEELISVFLGVWWTLSFPISAIFVDVGNSKISSFTLGVWIWFMKSTQKSEKNISAQQLEYIILPCQYYTGEIICPLTKAMLLKSRIYWIIFSPLHIDGYWPTQKWL